MFLPTQPSQVSLPGGSDGKESTCNSGDPGLIPRLGRSPGEGNDYPLQYSCLKNSMDRGLCEAAERQTLAKLLPWDHRVWDPRHTRRGGIPGGLTGLGLLSG